ncbi:terminase [Rhodovulum sp. BSW8]|uniref:terminase n=1 Tax=Rhodovulum sp. BSW8 TaxID=2259645 RepID=UPI000DE524AD|nr:terminase [Rhodovulum sp. BSW8]RBO54663.1 terminase [Rhodovulum sp. BSW8]
MSSPKAAPFLAKPVLGLPARAGLPDLPRPLPLDFVPKTDGELLAACHDVRWRLFSGFLYKIMTKEDEHQEGAVVPFRPNFAQRDFLNALHYRNVIVKARQLGFTTMSSVVFLDHSIFTADQRSVIIAHTLRDAGRIFRDKVKFAYARLPDPLREIAPLETETAEELLFAHNNSAMEVTVSARSGTVNRLHVSEMGKIAAKNPGKSTEIITGSFPAVPSSGIAIVESTAEGPEGDFFDLAAAAEKRSRDPRPLAKSEWKLHFYGWWRDPGYVADPAGVRITGKDHEYFDQVEVEQGCRLSLPQRAFYIGKRDHEQAGNVARMWQEYPSTFKEAFQRSTEGTFFGPQMAAARAAGRIGIVPHIRNVAVHTCWDIGAGDGTGIWCFQQIGLQKRFLRYIQGWGEGYGFYVKLLRDTGWLFGIHLLPHDALQKRQQGSRVASPLVMLNEIAPDWDFHIVPRVDDFTHGIKITREAFQDSWFHEDPACWGDDDEVNPPDCSRGLDHLQLYHKKWNARMGAFSEEPEKLDGHSEAADAFRQHAQGWDPALFSGPSAQRRRDGDYQDVGGRDRHDRPQGGMAV